MGRGVTGRRSNYDIGWMGARGDLSRRDCRRDDGMGWMRRRLCEISRYKGRVRDLCKVAVGLVGAWTCTVEHKLVRREVIENRKHIIDIDIDRIGLDKIGLDNDRIG